MNQKSEVRISVRVYPGALRNEIKDFASDVWQVRVAAPPVRDKANKELTAFLSEILGVPKSRVGILRGHTSHNKIISIEGLRGEEIARRLSAATRKSEG